MRRVAFIITSITLPPGVLIGALAVTVLAAAAGAGTAAAGGSLMIGGNLVLVAGIAVVATVPLPVRLARARLDIFEPVVLTSAALLLFLVARPLYDISVNEYEFLGRDVSDTYGAALLAALVAAIAIQVPYHTPLPARLARRLPKPSAALHNDIVVATALALTAVAGLFLLWSAAQRGGVALSLSTSYVMSFCVVLALAAAHGEVPVPPKMAVSPRAAWHRLRLPATPRLP